MESHSLKRHIGKAENTGESQRDHKQFHPWLKLISAFSQHPAVGKRSHDGIINRVPQTRRQKHPRHPSRRNPQHICTECQKIGVHKQVHKASCHISKDIPHLVLYPKGTR